VPAGTVVRAPARRHERNPVTEALEPIPDAELIRAVRGGDVSAFGALYERHLVAAKRAAVCLASTQAEREDLIAEAFTRVLRMLRDGRGPDEEFRPYLLVTLRNTAISGTSRGAPVSLYADVPEVAPVRGADGPVIDRWNASAAADAFASLPERWRVVLWHTEVENESPAEVAPLLGMRPNSVAALAYRAREGLRQAYLRMHTPEPPRRECRPTVDKLAGYVRHNVPLPLSRKIGKHLNVCPECRGRAEALRKVNSELRGLLGPLVLGAPLAAAYLPAPAVTGAVSGVLGATAASGGALAAASEVATTTVSGVLAMKATVVQVAAALAVTTTAVTVSASAPPVQSPGGERPVVAVSLPASSQRTAIVTPVVPTSRYTPTASASPAAVADEPGNAAEQGGGRTPAVSNAGATPVAAARTGTTATKPAKKPKKVKEKKAKGEKKPKKAKKK
jgi:RNA polymerase sigma factor (sigma-70 family)